MPAGIEGNSWLPALIGPSLYQQDGADIAKTATLNFVGLAVTYDKDWVAGDGRPPGRVTMDATGAIAGLVEVALAEAGAITGAVLPLVLSGGSVSMSAASGEVDGYMRHEHFEKLRRMRPGFRLVANVNNFTPDVSGNNADALHVVTKESGSLAVTVPLATSFLQAGQSIIGEEEGETIARTFSIVVAFAGVTVIFNASGSDTINGAVQWKCDTPNVIITFVPIGVGRWVATLAGLEPL